MSDRETVVLRPAYSWQCPSCGCVSFVEDEGAELGDDEAAEVRADFKLPEGCEIEAVNPPEAVECYDCHKVFDVWHEDDDE